jgi:hypothetical protein
VKGMTSDRALADKISKIQAALDTVEQLTAAVDAEQRDRCDRIRHALEIALDIATSSCACIRSPSRTCSLTGISLED